MNQQQSLQLLNELNDHADGFLFRINHQKPKTSIDRINKLAGIASDDFCMHCIIGVECDDHSDKQDSTIANKINIACEDKANALDMLDDDLFDTIEAVLLHGALTQVVDHERVLSEGNMHFALHVLYILPRYFMDLFKNATNMIAHLVVIGINFVVSWVASITIVQSR